MSKTICEVMWQVGLGDKSRVFGLRIVWQEMCAAGRSTHVSAASAASAAPSCESRRLKCSVNTLEWCILVPRPSFSANYQKKESVSNIISIFTSTFTVNNLDFRHKTTIFKLVCVTCDVFHVLSAEKTSVLPFCWTKQ